jgi:hypothetical protein
MALPQVPRPLVLAMKPSMLRLMFSETSSAASRFARRSVSKAGCLPEGHALPTQRRTRTAREMEILGYLAAGLPAADHQNIARPQ